MKLETLPKKIPPHTTHLLQPLDVGVFNHIKGVWQTVVADFTRRERDESLKGFSWPIEESMGIIQTTMGN